MKCPQCGKGNPEGAKFCSGCGISLDNKVELISNKDNSAEESASNKDSFSANKFSIDASIRAGIQKVLNRHGKKKVALIGGGAAIVLVAAIVAAVMVLNAGPSEAEFKSAVEANKTAWAQNSSSSSYGPDGAYKVMSVDDITSTKSKMPQGLLSSIYGGDIYQLTGKAKASNGSIEAEGTAQAAYIKSGDSWQAVAAPSITSITYKATTGVEEAKIIKNAANILSMASSGSNFSTSLSSLYKDSQPKVESVKLTDDGTGCTAVLKFEKSTLFSEAKATVTAHFSLKQGVWNLDSAEADKNANKVSYDKLVGTWTGKFQSQDAMNDHHCYGAQGKEMTLKINSIDPDSLKVEGTFSGLVHKHLSGEADTNSTDGDTMLQNQPFTATLKTDYYSGSYLGSMELGASYTAPESDNLETELILGFGKSDDPNAATAVIHSSYDTNKSLLSFSWYYDIYTLTKNK